MPCGAGAPLGLLGTKTSLPPHDVPALTPFLTTLNPTTRSSCLHSPTRLPQNAPTRLPLACGHSFKNCTTSIPHTRPMCHPVHTICCRENAPARTIRHNLSGLK